MIHQAENQTTQFPVCRHASSSWADPKFFFFFFPFNKSFQTVLQEIIGRTRLGVQSPAASKIGAMGGYRKKT